MTLTADLVMAAGKLRIATLVEKHGITSPEVFAACERWGGILDDVNHPHGSCRNCGDPVQWDSVKTMYIHGTSGHEHCRTVAAGVADIKPGTEDVQVTLS